MANPDRPSFQSSHVWANDPAVAERTDAGIAAMKAKDAAAAARPKPTFESPRTAALRNADKTDSSAADRRHRDVAGHAGVGVHLLRSARTWANDPAVAERTDAGIAAMKAKDAAASLPQRFSRVSTPASGRRPGPRG